MVSFVTIFWNICILRAGPESVPARIWFAVVLLIADIAVLLVQQGMMNDLLPEPDRVTMLHALGFNLVVMAAVAVFTRSALYFRKFGERFLATITALIGTHLLITVLIVAVTQLSNLVGLPPLILVAVLEIWRIVVWGFIYQRAFNTTLMLGIPLAFVVFILANVVALATSAIVSTFG